MRKLNKTDITNELDKYQVTHKDIETQIVNYSLNFLNTLNKRVEWGMSFPIFVPPFYDYLTRNNGTVPQQEEYWNAYFDCNSKWFNEKRLSDDLIHGLKARIYRTYPSLIRDIHFAKYLQTTLTDIAVIYDMHLDIQEGIDLLLVKNGAYHAINLYTDTRRAYIGRQKKTFRHKNYSNVNYIELPVSFQGSKKVGDFFLYGERELRKISNTI
ncbi:MAG: hypothetical protein QF443_03160 [Dehalococcoidia bacterium]|jgi:hypothetical protein|nr:hypothetical protein [Dehalococcoidia bacterium]|tara:strand:- start:970 stop:1605 length:636 start_codon:yes stop_codon:yes gene_type:complete